MLPHLSEHAVKISIGAAFLSEDSASLDLLLSSPAKIVGRFQSDGPLSLGVVSCWQLSVAPLSHFQCEFFQLVF